MEQKKSMLKKLAVISGLGIGMASAAGAVYASETEPVIPDEIETTEINDESIISDTGNPDRIDGSNTDHVSDSKENSDQTIDTS